MKKTHTKFKGLILIKGKTHYDRRGFFRELIHQNLIPSKIVFTVISKSKKNILRGLHFQEKRVQGKFLSVLKGKIFDVGVDLRKNSKTYLKYFSCELSEKNNVSIYLPPGFAHGFYTFEKENIILYGCTNYRDKNSEKGIIWNDKDLKIKWPCTKPVLSKKDKLNKSLREYLNFKNGKL
tara:strand:- start:358 stop:894 length:537 start_codon:yes stop_codon:yes gene_type:complete